MIQIQVFMVHIVILKKPTEVGFCGEYQGRTGDLLHAMQAL